MTLLFLTLIATAILAGVREGMIMCQVTDKNAHVDDSFVRGLMNLGGGFPPLDILGVRNHRWFKTYHAIRIATVAGYAILGWYLISHFVTTWQYLVTLCLAAVLANDLFEYGYSYARFKTLVNPFKESFNIADMIKFHASSKTLHIIRLILIVVLIGIMVA